MIELYMTCLGNRTLKAIFENSFKTHKCFVECNLKDITSSVNS